LRNGVVPGEGLLLASPETQPFDSVDSDIAFVDQPRPLLEPPARAEPIAGAPPEEAPRKPLPAGSAASEPTPQPEVEGAHVHVFLCARGHLNDPRALFCASCGIRMAERTGVLVEGIRPPLGLLVFDDGTSFVLDDDYLLGRQPDVDERVREGVLRPLIIDDDQRLVSRAHLEITLKGWDVYISDTGTANGTLVVTSATQAPTALVPGRPLRLPPGARVSIGKRSFVFESSLSR
ncbi:MAG TPA: FHA domain-containing protein, partial [Pseudonocardiaceae bacterium]|nr:FHA domain-containing protein [Pseudonocardiaceae bacterium]